MSTLSQQIAEIITARRLRLKLEDVIKQPGAEFLDKDGNLLPIHHPKFSHLALSQRKQDGTTKVFVIEDAGSTPLVPISGTTSPAVYNPQIVNPPNPSDIGEVNDYSNNILWSNPADIKDINQNQCADCYYLAPLGSMIFECPWYVQQLVTKNPDNTFATRFFRSGTMYQVNVNGQLDMSYNQINPNTGAIGGCISEKGYAYFRYGLNSYDSLNYGYQGQSFLDMGCGSGATFTTLGVAGITTWLMACLAKNQPVVGSTNPATNNNIVDSHVYMFIDCVLVGTTDATFTIANPWDIGGVGGSVFQINYQTLVSNFNMLNNVNSYPTPSATISVDNANISSENSATLSWNSMFGQTVSINGQSVGYSGSMAVSPSQTTQYVLTVTNPTVSVSTNVTVNVTAAVVDSSSSSSSASSLSSSLSSDSSSLSSLSSDSSSSLSSLSSFSSDSSSSLSSDSSASSISSMSSESSSSEGEIIMPADLYNATSSVPCHAASEGIRVGGIYEVCSEGDKNLYWTAAGNCVLFTVNVPDAIAKPNLVVRVYSVKGAKMGLDISNEAQPTVTIPVTGQAQSWTDVTIPLPSLAAGVQIVKVYAVEAGMGIESIRFD